MEIREARPQPGAFLPAVLPGDRSRVEEGLDRDGDAPDGPHDPYTRGHDAPADDEEAAGRGDAREQADDDGDADSRDADRRRDAGRRDADNADRRDPRARRPHRVHTDADADPDHAGAA